LKYIKKSSDTTFNTLHIYNEKKELIIDMKLYFDKIVCDMPREQSSFEFKFSCIRYKPHAQKFTY